MFASPGVERANEWGEAFAAFAQRVFDSRWHFRIGFSENELIPLQFTEGLDQHLFAHIRDEFFEFPVTLFSAREVPEEDSFPLADDEAERFFEWT